MAIPAVPPTRQSADQISSLRTPPNSIEFEKALLGAVILDGSSFLRVRDLVDESSFYRPAHALIYSAMVELDNHHEPVDMVTISEQLRRKDKLEAIGGLMYLAELAEAIPSAANVEHYARAVHEKAMLRKIIALGQQTTTDSYDSAAHPDEVLGNLQTRLVGLIAERRGRHATSMKDVMHETVEYVQNLKAGEGYLRGVGSGFHRMDDFTAGFGEGEFVVIAARPSMGKTSLAMNIATSASAKYHHAVGVFSLEMETRQLTLRMLAGEAKIDLKRLSGAAHLKSEEYQRMVGAAGRLAELPIYLDDSPGLGIDAIRSRARQLWIEHEIKMLIIDYLQLIQPPKQPESLQQWVSYVSASLKSLAKELRIPIVCLSQLSRAPETRGGEHKPVLSDLRDSGAIEQDADIVMFVYRPEVYKDAYKKNKYDFNGKEYDLEGFAEIIVAKNRNGPTGSFPLSWLGKYTMFANFSDEVPPLDREGAVETEDEEDEETF